MCEFFVLCVCVCGGGCRALVTLSSYPGGALVRVFGGLWIPFCRCCVIYIPAHRRSCRAHLCPQGEEKQGKVSKLAKNEVLMLNIGSMCTGARVLAVGLPLPILMLSISSPRHAAPAGLSYYFSLS
jgi:hypothetical protein